MFFIHSMIDNGEYDDAQEQLDILEELEENIASTPTFLFVKASFMRHRLSQKPEATNLLFRAYKLQMESVELMTFGVDYFSSLNPDFLLSPFKVYGKDAGDGVTLTICIEDHNFQAHNFW